MTIPGYLTIFTFWAVAVTSAMAQWIPESDFRFQNGESVGIGVFRGGSKAEVLMKKSVTLDGSGKATLDNGKKVKIGFGNIKSAMAKIEEGYRTGNDLMGLDVEAVILSRGGKGVVTLLGEVARPGHSFWREGMTLAEVAAAAGGFRPDAYLKRVAIQRGPDLLVIDCREEKTAREFKVESGDFITVDIAPLN